MPRPSLVESRAGQANRWASCGIREDIQGNERGEWDASEDPRRRVMARRHITLRCDASMCLGPRRPFDHIHVQGRKKGRRICCVNGLLNPGARRRGRNKNAGEFRKERQKRKTQAKTKQTPAAASSKQQA
ncbi:predicted protein [Coccidioides posadasii str. Silveira]|uniref:Predicted protein n=1 Tax=Coccidioides posadasii (strain RMSCC 757 / Silveira) TaxID=443226 RepID=E9DIS5_COCPS|nr:predicted protein [Coccidioides posadasii str. Silveira]